jgi:hypothetical protein
MDKYTIAITILGILVIFWIFISSHYAKEIDRLKEELDRTKGRLSGIESDSVDLHNAIFRNSLSKEYRTVINQDISREYFGNIKYTPDVLSCKYCGTLIFNDEHYCEKCGAPLPVNYHKQRGNIISNTSLSPIDVKKAYEVWSSR